MDRRRDFPALLTAESGAYINQLIRRIRASETPVDVIDEIANRISQASTEIEPEFPDGYEEWEFPILRNGLANQVALQKWASVLSKVADVCPMSFQESGEFSKGELLVWTHIYEELDILPRLCSAIRSSPEFWKKRGNPATLLMSNPGDLLGRIRTESLTKTKIHIEYEETKVILGLPANFEDLSPHARTKVLLKAGPNRTVIEKFTKLGAQSNILRQVEKLLPAAASGIQGYTDFRTLRNRTPFPPSEDTIGERSATSRLKSRKNARPGAILIRSCVCSGKATELLCPLHSFWKHIQATAQRGERLSPQISKSAVNKTLKKSLRNLGVESAKRHSSRAFRRDAAMELQGSGSSMGQIANAGGRSASAFKVYLLLDKAGGGEIDHILTRNNDSGSSSEEGVE